MKAAHIMKLIKKPVPWTVMAAAAIATLLFMGSPGPTLSVEIKLVAKDAFKSKGYAGRPIQASLFEWEIFCTDSWVKARSLVSHGIAY